FSKRFADRFGKKDVFRVALFISTLFIMVFYFFSKTDVFLMFSSQILHGFFYGLTIPLLWAMIADVADYSEWKNHRRATGIIFSAMMVGLKGGLSIGSALVAGILGLYAYITKEAANIGEAIVQPESAVQGTKMLVSIYPAIPFLVGIGLLFFYEINKKMEVEIESDLKARRTKS
ncbi:hypothetical protein LCGC14_1409440, partial [marine sediment metagenome]